MPDIEQRMKTLERQARANEERWQALDEQMKGDFAYQKRSKPSHLRSDHYYPTGIEAQCH